MDTHTEEDVNYAFAVSMLTVGVVAFCRGVAGFTDDSQMMHEEQIAQRHK